MRILPDMPDDSGIAPYPWDDWLSNQTIAIKLGEDFTCELKHIDAYIRRMAKARGLMVTSHQIRWTNELIFRTYAPGQPKPRIPTSVEQIGTALDNRPAQPTCPDDGSDLPGSGVCRVCGQAYIVDWATTMQVLGKREPK